MEVIQKIKYMQHLKRIENITSAMPSPSYWKILTL